MPGDLSAELRLQATIAAYARSTEPADDDDDTVARFLRLACLTYTEPHDSGAAAMLREDPALATASAYTMAACGRADELAELLRTDPDVVRRDGGPHAWAPLLYLCYSRLGLGDPVASMRVLLEGGADPDSGFLWNGFPSPFTALTGVLGGGERGEPAHPRAVELARLLLEAGADPNDNQAFYNRMFEPDDSHLPLLLSYGAGQPHPSVWRDRLGSAYPTPEEMLGEHLRSAAEHGYAARVELLLEHGVDPNTTGYHPILGDQNAYEVAVRRGQRACADLLSAAGGRSDRLDDVDWLLVDAMAGDRAGVRRRVAATPGLGARAVVRRPDALAVAAEHHGRAALELLLEIGLPVDAADRDGRTALHEAALTGDATLCRWLVERGADRSVRDRRFGSTPAGWADHAGHSALAAELAPPV